MLLFLDFDGVLHPVTSLTEPKFCRMDMLEGWLRARPGVHVVISSSWREEFSFTELADLFSEDLRGRVVGCTPTIDEVPEPTSPEGLSIHGFAREAEIRHWLSQGWGRPCAWAVLDDMPELFSPGCPELVLCDPLVGLTQRQLDTLDARLGLLEMVRSPKRPRP